MYNEPIIKLNGILGNEHLYIYFNKNDGTFSARLLSPVTMDSGTDPVECRTVASNCDGFGFIVKNAF